MSSLDSAIRILKCLTLETPALRVSEIAERLGLPKSTVSRLLKTLSESGILDRNDETRQYVAGPMALQLGGVYMANNNVLDLVDEAVRRLVELFRFTGYIAVLEDSELVVLRCRQGGYPLKFVLEIGSRHPAVDAALGIALLAKLDDAGLERALTHAKAANPPASFNLGATKDLVEQVRRDGYIEIPCLSVPGITAIGSAVYVPGIQKPAVGFSISFPTIAANQELRDRMARQVLASARAIENRMTNSSSNSSAKLARAAV